MALTRSTFIDDEAPLTVAVQGSIAVDPTTSVAYDIKVKENTDGQPQYIGEALPGTSTAAAAWRVRQITYSNGKFASSAFVANGAFNQVWNTYV